MNTWTNQTTGFVIYSVNNQTNNQTNSTMKSRLHKLLNQPIENLDQSNNKPIREMSIHKSDRINN